MKLRGLMIVLLGMVAIGVGACASGESTAEPASAAVTSTSSPTATSTGMGTADPAPNPFAEVPGIVDPDNRGWPREVEGLNGVVSIAGPAQRIHTTSVGLDEVTLGLVPVSRVVGVGTSSQNPDYSNVAELVAHLPGIKREPEEIAALEPDLVVVSTTQDADFIAALERLEIPVIQLPLVQSPEGRIHTTLLMGYLYGEEERALELAAEVRARHEAVVEVTALATDRPVVMYLTFTSDTLRTAGVGSTAEGITLAAGGVCGPCAAGMQRTAEISDESIVAVNPDVIMIPMNGEPAEAFRASLLANAALAEVPAIKNAAVHLVPIRLHSTLSYANVAAAEQLAALLWPEQFPAEYRDSPPPFSRPE